MVLATSAALAQDAADLVAVDYDPLDPVTDMRAAMVPGAPQLWDEPGNIGSYFTVIAHFIATTHVAGCLPTVYDIPLAQVNARCVFTNTVPTGPYRGAGRPEARYLLERVIDAAADPTGIDAAELRRRNMIAPEKIPYATPFRNRLHRRFRARAEARRLSGLRGVQKGGEKSRQAARHRISASDAPLIRDPAF